MAGWWPHRFPQGLEDVSTYPVLIEELLRRGWSEEELWGVLRGNLLRVFSQVEQVCWAGPKRSSEQVYGGYCCGSHCPLTATSRFGRKTRDRVPWRMSSQMSSWEAPAAPSSRICSREKIWLKTRN